MTERVAEAPTRSSAFLPIGGAVVLAASALSHLVPPLTGVLGFPDALLDGVTGLCLVLAVPGAAYLPILGRLRPSTPWSPFRLVLAGIGTTVACHALGHALVISVGLEAAFWPMWLQAAVLWSIGTLLGRFRGAPIEVDWPPRPVLLATTGAAALLALFVVLTSPPGFVPLSQYTDIDPRKEIPKLVEKTEHEKMSATLGQLAFGEEWHRGPGGRLDLVGADGTLFMENAGTEERKENYGFVLLNLGPEAIRFRICAEPRDDCPISIPRCNDDDEDSEKAAFHELPPVFDHRRHPRNARPDVLLFLGEAHVPPGKHLLHLQIEPLQGADEPRVRVFDLNGLSPEAVDHRTRQLLCLCNLGDVFEAWDLSRNFRYHIVQYTGSVHGESFDGGGPTSLSDEPPGHHFLCFLALTFIRDTVGSCVGLHLAEMVLLFLLSVHLMGWAGGRFHPGHLLAAFAAVAVYSRMCRLPVESMTPDTLFLLVWLCFTRIYLDRARWLPLALVGVLTWIHIPTLYAVVLLCVAHFVVTRRARPILFLPLAAIAMALTAGVRLACLVPLAGRTRALTTGQASFMGLERTAIVRGIVEGDVGEFLLLLQHEGELWANMVLLTCLCIPLFVVARFVAAKETPPEHGERADTLFVLGVLWAAGLGALTLVRAYHLGPAVMCIAIASVARVTHTPSKRWLNILLGLLCAGWVLAWLCLWWFAPDRLGLFHLDLVPNWYERS